MSEHLDLLDYRRRVFEIYRKVRGGQGESAWKEWIRARDELFATHPQSAVEDRGAFTGLSYFDYDPSWALTGRLDSVNHDDLDLAHSGDGKTTFTKIGTVHFNHGEKELSLEVLWLTAYAGGLFVPFRDQTNGEETYGGGRYLLDTVKGADLGHSQTEILLDFNYAYHPSCVHSARWSCPLAPPANRLDVAVAAGERLS